ncbi:MAG TPA: glycosyltransferase family 39 protein [Verrucomicrobiae bacterium]|nr:glycosyltransferase family 39 protein [Verrucomicrobiae bacterium]
MIKFKSDNEEVKTEIRLADSPQRSAFQLWPWLFVLLIVVLMAFVRYRLLDLPLERDEGEYASAGQLMLEGIPPYQLMWNMKLPGTYFACALGMAAFGQTAAGIHATLIVANSLTIIFVFLLGQRLFGTIAGLAACATYGVLSASPVVLGLAAHANQFVMLFAVWGAWQLWKAEEFYRWHAFVFSGMLFGLAFIMKQQGICFCLFAAAIVFWHAIVNGTMMKPLFLQKLFFLCVGMALPFAAVCAYLNQMGVSTKFWFWTFDYARSYATELTLLQGLQHFGVYARKAWPIYFPFLGFVLVSLPFVFRDRALRGQIIFGATFLFFSVVGASIDLYFREHYFILILPALAIFMGLAIVSLQFATENNAFKIIPPLICLLILAGSVYQQRQFYFQLPANAVSRIIYKGDAPFADMPAVGSYIAGHSGPNATLAVVGSEPEIYFYAQRHPATGYIYTYPLMEPQPYAKQMQAEMIGEIETNRPEYLVYVSNPGSWNARPGSDRSIFDWFTQYSGKFYDRVALVDQISWSKTAFVSGKDIKNYHLIGRDYVGIFKRKDPGETKDLIEKGKKGI